MLRNLLFLAAFACAIAAQAQAQALYADVRVGLLGLGTPHGIMVMGDQGPLDVWADGKKVAQLDATDGLSVRFTAQGITAKSLSLDFSAKKKIEFRSPLGRGFRVRTTQPKGIERVYPGVCEVRSEKGGLRLIATVPLEEYVAGTVQAEAGKGHTLEYYKLQAVSCRTYALANKRRHAAEGFEVCDGTHCQVFQGRNLQDTIRLATTLTRDLVVVDPDIQLIHSTFHSNCGGETMNADELWSGSETYLVSTMDTFCLNAPHATWTRSIPRSKWLAYMRNKGVDTDDSTAVATLTDHVPVCREIYLANCGDRVPLDRLRKDFDLRSTFFSMHPVGDQVVLEGRGFGHGVGLCQEGAMEMAKDGYSYYDILHHYFAEVHIVDLKSLDFFRDEDVNGQLLPHP